MSAADDEELSETSLAELLASSGVAVTQDEIAPVARTLARINTAARLLLRPSFDDTVEAYYRLLEQDGAGADA
jgi:hypothetical protein